MRQDLLYNQQGSQPASVEHSKAWNVLKPFVHKAEKYEQNPILFGINRTRAKLPMKGRTTWIQSTHFLEPECLGWNTTSAPCYILSARFLIFWASVSPDVDWEYESMCPGGLWGSSELVNGKHSKQCVEHCWVLLGTGCHLAATSIPQQALAKGSSGHA
jgi:hypothetical protein